MKEMIHKTDEQLLAECDVEFFIAGGPGGQHRNKSSTAVRLYHRPTGLVSAATERRSQLQNKMNAILRLREKIEKKFHRQKPRVKTRASRASKERRLSSKNSRGKIKSNRQKVGDY